MLCIMNFNTEARRYTTIELPAGSWRKVLDSSEERWMGPGSTIPDTIPSENNLLLPPSVIVLYQREVR